MTLQFERHKLQHVTACMLCMLSLAFSLMVATKANAQTANVEKGGRTVVFRGSVIDDDGAPLPGANITVKGQKGVGVITDNAGEFAIKLPQGKYTLVVSYIGMVSQELRAVAGKRMTIRMVADAVAVQETVVTGIYTRNIESFTGSVATFSGDDLKKIAPQGVLKSLAALDPSIIITENNLQGSNPNAKTDITINGKMNVTTLSQEYETDPNQPLFILDGFETTLQVISDLNMDRVESISILKDAASTAIYGSKAANGVVVVETVKPKPGQLKVSYNGSLQIGWADLHDFRLMNSAQKLEYEKLAGEYGL